MRVTVALLISYLSILPSIAQSKFEVRLKSGAMYAPTSLEVKNSDSEPKHLILNHELKIEFSNLDYYQTETDFFIVRTIDSYKDQEMRRIENGKIQVFTFLKPTLSGDGHNHSSMSDYHSRNVYYYEKDLRLRKLSLKYLEMDLQDNPEALDQIREYKKNRSLAYGLWAAGAAMTIVGVNEMTNEANEEAPPPFIAGVVMGIAPFFFLKNHDQTLLSLIRHYNAKQGGGKK